MSSTYITSTQCLILRKLRSWEDGKDLRDIYPLPLRAQQLEFRHHEVHSAYSTFRRLLRDDPTLEIDTIDGSVYNKQSWTTLGENGETKVRTDEDVALTGHSFGGCTTASIIIFFRQKASDLA